jgi:hypothetical protein
MKLTNIFFSLLILTGLSSCDDKDILPEKQVVCTEEFRTVAVRFKNAAGNYMAVSNFKAVVERTGVTLDTNNELGSFYYTVASDLDKKKLLVAGENVNVTATNPSNGNVITAKFKIAGDACHITKISGPDEITVN